MDCGLEGFLRPPVPASSFAVLKVSKKGLPSRGDSGEKDGKEVKDLSEAAIEEAELDGCEVNLALWRDLVRIVCLPPLLAEAADSCDVDRSRGVTEDEREEVGSIAAGVLQVTEHNNSGPSLTDEAPSCLACLLACLTASQHGASVTA